jgi:hypothetical protein
MIKGQKMVWTTGTLSSADPWNCVTFGNGRFATVANITGNTASSSDGITWQQGSSMPGMLIAGRTWHSVMVIL